MSLGLEHTIQWSVLLKSPLGRCSHNQYLLGMQSESTRFDVYASHCFQHPRLSLRARNADERGCGLAAIVDAEAKTNRQVCSQGISLLAKAPAALLPCFPASLPACRDRVLALLEAESKRVPAPAWYPN